MKKIVYIIENLTISQLILFILLTKIPLLLLAPSSLLYDAYSIYLPFAKEINNGEVSGFFYPPLYSLLMVPFILIPNFQIQHLLIKLLSLSLFICSILIGRKILEEFKIKCFIINLVVISFSLFAWPTLISVSVHSDILFLFFTMISIYAVITYNKDAKSFLYTLISVTCLLYTKPTGWILIPILILLPTVISLFRTEKKLNFQILISNFRDNIFRTLTPIFFSMILFSIWLVRNYLIAGTLYGIVSTESQANVLSFIGSDRFSSQIANVFRYFWEIPWFDQVRSVSLNPYIQHLGQAYTVINILIFFTISILIIFSITSTIKSIINSSILSTDIVFLFISSTIVFFSVFYWPFFGLYNYWDPGRYVVPVFLFLITVLLNYIFKLKGKLKFFAISGFVFSLLISQLNSVVMLYKYNINEAQLFDIVNEYKNAINGKKLIVNDRLTEVILRYHLNNEFEFANSFKCIKAERINTGIYYLCSMENEFYLFNIVTSKSRS